MLKSMSGSSSTMKEHLRQVFLHAVEAVSPHQLVTRSLSRQGSSLGVYDKRYSMDNNVYLVGFGKAVLRMAAAAVPLLDGHLRTGILSVPLGSCQNLTDQLQKKNIEVIEGAKDNLPDDQSVAAARKIKKLVSSLGSNDILLVLISGGGSALLPMPKRSITLQEKQEAIKLLSHSGASITELNQVRIALSELKGGQLAHLANGAQVVSLILSDIIGDPMHLIASGPTVQPPLDSHGAMEIVEKYNLRLKMPDQVITCLEQNQPVPLINLENVLNVLIGNNMAALKAAAFKAQELGHTPVIISDSVSGDVNKVSEFYVNLSKAHLECRDLSSAMSTAHFPLLPFPELSQRSQSVVFIAGGEPTVVVKGTGKGGRNQELALRVGRSLPSGTCFLSAGTDGLDGPTDAAGAVCGADCQQPRLDEYLANNDSYSFLEGVESGRDFIMTGHTGTNVMDVHLLMQTS